MTLAYETERRLRHNRRGPLDCDASLVPGKIVASIMHLGRVTDREDEELGLALRSGYGSMFGQVGAHQRPGEDRAGPQLAQPVVQQSVPDDAIQRAAGSIDPQVAVIDGLATSVERPRTPSTT